VTPVARPALILVLAAVAGASGEAHAQTSTCPDMARPVLIDAPPASPDSSARGFAYWRWSHAFERETTGVGVLEPAVRSDGSPPGYDWLPDVSLPLYARPDDEAPAAWMHLGWWVVPSDRTDDRVLGYRGMLETDYEQASLVVMQAREDGWVQVWVDIGPIARAVSHGLMWTHTCLLDLGSTPLGLSLWEDRFVGPGAPPLSFMGESRHALRGELGVGGSLIAWLEPEDEVELLEISGDWARVRASRPGRFLTGCLGEEWRGESLAGWVRWRDSASGSWLWYPTRGC